MKLKYTTLVLILFTLSGVCAPALEIDSELKDAFKKAGLPLLALRQKAPAFTLPRLDGNAPARLEDFKGGIVVLNFWATWCPPCRNEMPSLQALFDYFKNQKEAGGAAFNFFAIDCGENIETVRSFISSNRYTFPVLIDKTGEASRAYNTRAIPVTVIIDGDGSILVYYTGGRNWNTQDVRDALALLLKKRAAGLKR